MAASSRQRYVVVGGGIAGVSCAEELARLSPESEITVISDSSLIKAATNIVQQSRLLQSFDVEEKHGFYLEQRYGNMTVRTAHMTGLGHRDKVVECSDGSRLHYNKLCLCNGAKPKLIANDHPRVLGIRDTESVEDFQRKLKDARRIVVIGNGGIATELVYEVKGCEVVWAIKHDSICHTFVDEGASVFFLPHLEEDSHTRGESASGSVVPVKRTKYVYERTREAEVGSGGEERKNEVEGGERDRVGECRRIGEEGGGMGSALGPDWQAGRAMTGSHEHPGHVHVEYQCEVESLLTAGEVTSRGMQPSSITPGGPPGVSEGEQWPVYVVLTNGKVFGCDLLVSATGAYPNTDCLAGLSGDIELCLSAEGGVVVDNEMRSNLPDVYAAGDVCSANWDHSQLWFQMRLWTQGRQMGAYAARAMVAHTRKEEVSLDFCFELFAHVTKFFGYKVVLLGLFNAQGLPTSEYEVLLRCTKGEEYVKVVLRNGRMIGAILIGETDLEETFENLILNQMDLSGLKDFLLDPRVDIEDYFD